MNQESTSVTTSIVIPVYKEAANLAELITRADKALHEHQVQRHQFIVVDDDSQDGTKEICASLGKEFPVELITRKAQRGLASAVVSGFQAAKGEVLVVLDGDLSHPPEKIPELVDALKSAQFALGSRSLGQNQANAGNWLYRLNSWFASLLASGLTESTDSMSGFFALRRSSFLEVERLINATGYKIGLDLMVKLGIRKPAEVPIIFTKRKFGKSKQTIKVKLQYLIHLIHLYYYQATSKRR